MTTDTHTPTPYQVILAGINPGHKSDPYLESEMGTQAKKCTYDPTALRGPIGMFHCPECGEMQLAGLPHLPSVESEMSEHQEQMEPIIMLERMAKGQDATLYPEQRDAIKCLIYRIKELEQQRDAALKLAQFWLEALYFLPFDSDASLYLGAAYRMCAKQLRAIFATKEGK